MYQINAFSAVKASGIICLEIRCPIQSSNQLDEPSVTQTTLLSSHPFDETIFRTFPVRVESTVRTLRYLSLDLSPAVSRWRHDFLEPTHRPMSEIPANLRWWSFERESSGPTIRSMDAARGERIAAYLRSPRYDYSRPFNGASIGHDDVSSLNTIDRS